jgi:hypothetical protein
MRARVLGVSVAVLAGAILQSSSTGVLAGASQRDRGRSFSATLESYNEVPTLSVPVIMAHIHIGKSRLNGPIMVWLCQTATNVDPTGLSPACPVTEGTVEGTIEAAGILTAGTTGIAAGEFDEFVRTLRETAGYVNVHTTAFPGGEIRGQVNWRQPLNTR